MIIHLQHKSGRIQRVTHEILGLGSIRQHAGAYREIRVLVVISVEAILLVIILSRKQLDVERITDAGSLILVTRTFLHVHGNAHNNLAGKHILCTLVSRKQCTACYGSTIGYDAFQRSQKLQTSHLVCHSRSDKRIIAAHHVEADVDDLGKLADLSRGNDIHQIFEGKIACIHDLDIAKLGISGLPLIMIKCRSRVLSLGILPAYTVRRPIQLHVQHTGLNHVPLADHLISEPSQSGTKQHRKTKDQRHQACK